MPGTRAFGSDVGEIIRRLAPKNAAVGGDFDARAAHGGDFFGVVGQ